MNHRSHHKALHDFLRTRAIEEKMLIYLRQGKISKWFSSFGQEALSVAATVAMQPEEYICTMHRNLGTFVSRDVPLAKLFAQFQGKASGFTKGRDRSFHFGSTEHHIIGMISHLGAQLGLACGLALREKLSGSGKCVLAFTGDGSTSQGDFHEALNVAAVWQLPVVFVVERNYWGLSTPEHEQFIFDSFLQKGPAYGMEARSFDANDMYSALDHFHDAAQYARSEGKPIILEARTFRVRGHEEASGTKYYPEGMVEEAMKGEPLARIRENVGLWGIDEAELDELLEQYKGVVDQAFHEALTWDDPQYDLEESLADLYPPSEPLPEKLHAVVAEESKVEMRLIDAIHHGLDQALNIWPDLVYMGQDIGAYGGVFKATEGLMEKYGADRVRNTPLCESAIVGAALGMSLGGGKAMMEMQFSDFVSTGFNQIVNNLAKVHWRWGGKADVVVRMPTGAGVAAGPFHSQSTEAWFTHVPGLKVVYPAFPNEAKALLLSSFQDAGPVLFFEHKALYRTVKEPVEEAALMMPLGQAKMECEGTELVIVTYGMGVHWALDVAQQEGLSGRVAVLNLRTLVPLDWEAVRTATAAIGKVLVLQEDVAIGGFGEHIVARIAGECFEHLDAPVRLVSSDPTPVPFQKELEAGFLASAKLEEAVNELLNY
jgi:2-oxoisovalerate dehydrogenase E1 component